MGELTAPPNLMAKKKPVKKKQTSKKEKPRESKKDKVKSEPAFKEVQVNLHNVFQILVSNSSDALIRIDRLQKTVDAIGELLATCAIKKD